MTFKPLHKEALVISFFDYTNKPEIDGGLTKLPSSETDGKEMAKFLIENIGFDEHFVTTIPSPRAPSRPPRFATKGTVEKYFQIMVDTARIMSRIKQESLFFVYYSGHGCSAGDGDLSAYVPISKPPEKKEDKTVDLMKWVRTLASFENVYVVAFFDCCRTPDEDLKKMKKPSYALVGGHLYTIFSSESGQPALARAKATMSEVTELFLDHGKKKAGFDNFPFNLSTWPAKNKKAEILDKSSTFVDFSFKFVREEKQTSTDDTDFVKYCESRGIVDKQEQSKKRALYKLFNVMDDDKSGSVSFTEICNNLSYLGIKTGADRGVQKVASDYQNDIKFLNPQARKELEVAASQRCDRERGSALSFPAFVEFLNDIEPQKEKWISYMEYTRHCSLVDPILNRVWQGGNAQKWDDFLPVFLNTLFPRPEVAMQQHLQLIQVLEKAFCVNNNREVTKVSYDLFVSLWNPRFPSTKTDPTGLLFLKEIKELYDQSYFIGVAERDTSMAIMKAHPNSFHVRITTKMNKFCLTFKAKKEEYIIVEREQYFKMSPSAYITHYWNTSNFKGYVPYLK